MAHSPVQVTWPNEHVALLTLSFPERRNMMSDTMTRAWVDTVAALREERRLRAVVITGEGTAFCSGGDLSWLGSANDADVEGIRRRMLTFYTQWLSIRDLPVPLIAAINGPAVGAGMALAMACDLRFASPAASLSVPFTRLGIHPGMGSTWSLPAAVGPQVAADLLLTGRTIGGHEACDLGLVARVCEPDNLLPESISVAATIAAQAPQATALMVQSLRHVHGRTLPQQLEVEALAQAITLTGPEVREGLRAIKEKRHPRFTA